MLQKIITRFGKWRVIAAASALVLVVVGSFAFSDQNDAEESPTPPRAVTVAPIAALSQEESSAFVGTIRAVNRANLQSEVGGRVVAVPVAIGGNVAAGAVVAQLENASQRAALTQAEGAYEAAQAAAAQGESGVRDADTALTSARNGTLSTLRNSYTTASNILLTSIDNFYSNPQASVPGVRVSGDASFLNAERVAFEALMPRWRTETTNATANADLFALLDDAEENTRRLLTLNDAFTQITAVAKNSDTLLGQPLSSYNSGLLANRATLSATLGSLQSARSSLTAANEAVTRAAIAGTGADVSLANAQVKQALGALEAARAQYAKTIIRSPIGGTVSSLRVAAGDFVSPNSPIAEVVNESAYEISIFVTEAQRAGLAIGDTVTVGNNLSGIITNIAPAIDSQTQKIEVKISIESSEVLAGSTATVRLTKAVNNAGTTTLSVPITAVAFSVDQGSLLVVEEGFVRALPVTLGAIRGSHIEITSEVSPETEIIVDARGLVVGTEVTIDRN